MKRHPHDLGVLGSEKTVILYSNVTLRNFTLFHAGVSVDGLNFKKGKKEPTLLDIAGKPINTANTESFRISSIKDTYVMLYKTQENDSVRSAIAFSKNGYDWKTKSSILPSHTTAMVVPNTMFQNQYGMYYGDSEIHFASSPDLLKWEKQSNPVLTPRHQYFDRYPIEISSVIKTPSGPLVIYIVKRQRRVGYHYAVGYALFDRRNPTRLLYRTTAPLWEQGDTWGDETIYSMGAAHIKERLILYFGSEGKGVYAVCFPNLKDILEGKDPSSAPTLEKAAHNPIISPVLNHSWEASATFNTAAIDTGDKVHFVYRAMGPENTSVLGYASSSDGEHIDERAEQPIYGPTEWFETPGRYPVINFMSGGGYGGCEDPRITQIEDKLYMTYVAYNGCDHPRVALTSIDVEDFVQKRWNKWAKPRVISSAGVVNKNCVIFPEKINGKFVVMHRIFPNVLIDYVDDMEALGSETFLEGHHAISPRDDAWDSRKLGAGAPPIRTNDGWLLIYQAVDDRDPGKYKIGAMLLDLDHPEKVLYRSNTPILEPTHWYENEGFKAGVAYPCGAVIRENRLYVYYGGADTFIAVASAQLDKFLADLKKSSRVKPTFQPKIQPVQTYLYAHAN
jgi:predicted GH43/DUF377 family glycosyl hydrolase